MDKDQIQHLYMEDGTLNNFLKNRDLVIWGGGSSGKKAFESVTAAGCRVHAVCDSNIEASPFQGVPLIRPDELQAYSEYFLVLAFFAWPSVLAHLPDVFQGRIFADFPYYKKYGKQCLVCGSDNTVSAKAHFAPFIVEREFAGENKPTKLVTCSNCGMSYSEYRPNDEEMGRLYDQYWTKQYDEQRKRFEPTYSSDRYFTSEWISSRREGMYDFISSAVDLTGIKNVLDYGGDEGEYLSERFLPAQRFVFDISNRETVEGVIRIASLEELKNQSWDLILCSEMLEHVNGPKQFMRLFAELLASDAFLYVEVPHEENFKSYSDAEIHEHINFYSPKSLEKLGISSGFKLLSFKDSGFTYFCVYQKQ